MEKSDYDGTPEEGESIIQTAAYMNSDDEDVPLNPCRPRAYIVRINNDDDTYLTDEDNMDDDEDAEGAFDPSLMAPNGVTRRVRKSTLDNPPDVSVQRTALTVSQKHERFCYYEPVKPGLGESVKNGVRKKTTCSQKKARNLLYLRIPIFNWLFHYKIQKDLLNDVIAGVTVAVMNIPQGMAYAMLANLDPIIGIYMAFFPVLVYATFASSRHCSMGTFAVICIMAGKVVSELATPAEEGKLAMALDTTNTTTTYSETEVASMLSFAVGIWMLIFGVLQLGSLSVFLSDMLVSGFTTGASIHVLTSQVPKLFGMDADSYQGIFKIPKTWYSIFANILYSNPTTMVISLICFFVLIVNNEILKPKFRKITRIPFPIELVVVVVGTLASEFGDLNENFDVEIVGEIPTGLPPPQLPPFDLYSQMIISSLTITIVSYSVSYSMAKIFATKLDYSVDATQELYATGLANLMGSLFSCAPISASLSRSLIQQTVGGATQLASYISCSILVLVLLFIGPFFETLPNCVLASIIAVALKGMFLQLGDFGRMWKVSKVDALLWMLTFLGVVILDIDYGLLLGILATLLLLIVRNQAPITTLLGRIGNTDIYLDKTRYPSVEEIPGIKICQVLGNLHFANQDSFRTRLSKTTGLDPKAIIKWKRKQDKILKRQQKRDEMEKSKKGHHIIAVENGNEKTRASENLGDAIEINNMQNAGHKNDSKEEVKKDPAGVQQEVASLIIDFSGVSRMDIFAAKNLAQLQKEYETAGVVTVFAALSEPSLEIMSKCGASDDLAEEVFFHSIPDAIAFLTTPSIGATLTLGIPSSVVARL